MTSFPDLCEAGACPDAATHYVMADRELRVCLRHAAASQLDQARDVRPIHGARPIRIGGLVRIVRSRYHEGRVVRVMAVRYDDRKRDIAVAVDVDLGREDGVWGAFPAADVESVENESNAHEETKK